jgi:hypothetical protein
VRNRWSYPTGEHAPSGARDAVLAGIRANGTKMRQFCRVLQEFHDVSGG